MATLEGVGETIQNPHLLIRLFVRMEAVVSSRIEGTQIAISDLFMSEVSWIRYFLDGVLEQARDALVHSRKVRDLQQQYRRLLQHRHVSGNALCLLDEFFGNPYVTGPSAAGLLDVTDAGARRILERLKEAGIVEEWPGTWPRAYVARELLSAIEAPTASG